MLWTDVSKDSSYVDEDPKMSPLVFNHLMRNTDVYRFEADIVVFGFIPQIHKKGMFTNHTQNSLIL